MKEIIIFFKYYDMQQLDKYTKSEFYYHMGDILKKELPYLDNHVNRKWILIFHKKSNILSSKLQFIGFGSYQFSKVVLYVILKMILYSHNLENKDILKIMEISNEKNI